MQTFSSSFKYNQTILALGAESEGNFSIYNNQKIFFSDSFGDLLDETNFQKFKRAISEYFKKNKTAPDIVISDLHPEYKTTVLGLQLAKKFKAEHLQVQHHLAHIFSSIGEEIIFEKDNLPAQIISIACDGTGMGLDKKIWGGEIFLIKSKNGKIKNIQRIGHLENQMLIGGDLAIKEPSRMVISVLSNFFDKENIYPYIKKYYSKKEFELIYNQLKQKFNCQETSSTGRVLDGISVLLGFSKNQRNYKHQATNLLEKNSTKPYPINPKIIFDKKSEQYIILTTPLFQYLLKNISKDKKRLAATAQIYLAKGINEITKKYAEKPALFIAGGISKNKIMSSYLEPKGFYFNKKIPCGDAGISFGQIIYFLLNKS